MRLGGIRTWGINPPGVVRYSLRSHPFQRRAGGEEFIDCRGEQIRGKAAAERGWPMRAGPWEVRKRGGKKRVENMHNASKIG